MATSVHATRRVGAFATTRSTVVILWEGSRNGSTKFRPTRPFDSWERTPKGEKALGHTASTVSALLNPRKRYRDTTGPYVPSGRLTRRDRASERADDLASLNNVKRSTMARTPSSRYRG